MRLARLSLEKLINLPNNQRPVAKPIEKERSEQMITTRQRVAALMVAAMVATAGAFAASATVAADDANAAVSNTGNLQN